MNIDNKHEVEYRALITPEVFNLLLGNGRHSCAASFRGPLTIQDAYFCPREVKDFSEIEMNKVGSYSLRLRREISEEITIVTLNTKIIKNEGDHNAWLEHEVVLSSYEEGLLILESIGFKCFFSFKKDRFAFDENSIHVCLESIDDFQPAIEIEILTTEDKTEEAKKTLLDYFAKNNIHEDSIVKKSITNILMKARAAF